MSELKICTAGMCNKPIAKSERKVAKMSNTEKVTLLPCPFCGSEVVVIYKLEGDKSCWAECKTCWASSNVFDLDKEAKAVTAWNTRQPDKELVEALENICGTTCVDGYGKVIEIADAALGKYKE
jgi:Lar family restriction alleviation protein